MTTLERIWVGPAYPNQRLFVLGESWYGDFSDNLASDDGYIRAYLDGRVTDRMYTRMANACRMTPRQFWEGVMFTNFVQCVGATRNDRPTVKHYDDARERLSQIIEEHRPRGVWILGIGQAAYSAPAVKAAGIPFEITAHPTSYGLTNAALGASWKALVERIWDGHP